MVRAVATLWTTGDIAKNKSVTSTTVRNWEARGLLVPVAITRSGIKLFSESAVAKLDERRGA